MDKNYVEAFHTKEWVINYSPTNDAIIEFENPANNTKISISKHQPYQHEIYQLTYYSHIDNQWCSIFEHNSYTFEICLANSYHLCVLLEAIKNTNTLLLSTSHSKLNFYINKAISITIDCSSHTLSLNYSAYENTILIEHHIDFQSVYTPIPDKITPYQYILMPDVMNALRALEKWIVNKQSWYGPYPMEVFVLFDAIRQYKNESISSVYKCFTGGFPSKFIN